MKDFELSSESLRRAKRELCRLKSLAARHVAPPPVAQSIDDAKVGGDARYNVIAKLTPLSTVYYIKLFRNPIFGLSLWRHGKHETSHF